MTERITSTMKAVGSVVSVAAIVVLIFLLQDVRSFVQISRDELQSTAAHVRGQDTLAVKRINRVEQVITGPFNEARHLIREQRKFQEVELPKTMKAANLTIEKLGKTADSLSATANKTTGTLGKVDSVLVSANVAVKDVDKLVKQGAVTLQAGQKFMENPDIAGVILNTRLVTEDAHRLGLQANEFMATGNHSMKTVDGFVTRVTKPVSFLKSVAKSLIPKPTFAVR